MACSAIFAMNSKQPHSYSPIDQNWHWPEHTWFRERLQAVKSSQQEQRRRPLVSQRAATPEKPEDQNNTPGVEVD
jgi:hypothetical protein